jgi:ABC-type Fe3+/spermidine/putrescine transport system ATPase subunit/nucleotide-binding universal stress UspA family protein
MSIVLERLTKKYDGLVVVDQVSLDVADGELFVLLGTSGSGKSTILRLIAGLSRPDGGRILLRGRDVTALPPQQRGTGFVFQNYSIFRHMSVAENIEFGLKIRKTGAAERARRRDELLELVGMAGLGSRYADQLSGGQQQRVALARALAYEPSVLLLDEPFGALDVKTRAQLRRSLKDVQRKLGVTAILVTHDQDEAFELADRIGVLDHGRLLEVGVPEKLYASPRTLFAATFLGAGTVLVGRSRHDQARFGPVVLPIPPDVPHEDGAPVQVLFRPEEVVLSAEAPNDKSIVLGKGTIIEQSFTGALRRVRLRLPRLPATRQIAPPVPFGEEGMLVDAVVPAETRLAHDAWWVSLRGWHILQQPEPHILIFDAGQGSTSTLTLARQIVEQMDASATVLAVAGDQEEVETERAALLSRQHEAGLTRAQLRVRTGNPVEQIAAEQNESLYSLMMLAPRARRAPVDANGYPERKRLRRLNRLGPIVVRVLERASLPVMVVKKERPALKRLLICTAGGEPGKSDVRVGGRLARRLGASVTLLYVAANQMEPSRIVQSHLERAASTLRSIEVPVEVRVRQARTPAKGILAESREGDHDLIVVGSHGPQSRSIFGRDDVTLQVLIGADRPVLVVPAEEG